MFRYTIITALLVSNYVTAQIYDGTLGRNQLGIPKHSRNIVSFDPNNHSKVKRETVEDVVKWVNEVIKADSDKEESTKNPDIKLNLDPSNINIKDTSYSKPAEASNKFDDEIVSTPSVENCMTDDGKLGVCVLYYLCDANTRLVITDGATLLDERFGSPKFCGSYLEICCELKDRIGPQVDHKAEEQFLSSSHEPSRTDVFDADQSNSMSPPNTFGERNKECGWDHPELFVFRPANQSVADGVIYANYGEFPWMVALLKKSGTNVWVQNDYIGGGSIIHPSVVVTAYHKLLQVSPEELKCRAGEWDTQTAEEQYKAQDRDAEQFVSHEDFFRTSVFNDIALIFLKSPFDFAKAPHIGAACLSPVLPEETMGPCFSMGWGKVAKTDKTVNILKKVKLDLVEHETCRTMLHTNTRFRHIPNFKLHESLTCAGGEVNVDTCRGDGGSSLVCPIGRRGIHTRYAVVGMVAYGLECGKKDVPGVYVNVPFLYEWVEQKMQEAGFGISTYSF